MKHYSLCGLGNALVDIFLDVDDSTFQSLNLEKGSMRLVDPEEQRSFIARLAHKELPRVSGGSVANSIVAFAQLGGKAAFIGCVGNDAHGMFYKHEMDSLGIHFPVPPVSDAHTGSALCFITPDAERTMRTSLGISSALDAARVDEAAIRSSEWLFIEGYLFANPENGQGAIRRAISLAKEHGTRVAITASEPWVIDGFRPAVEEALLSTDLLFTNEHEFSILTGESDLSGNTALEAGRKKLPPAISQIVVTLGGKGAAVYDKGTWSRVDAFPCTPIDVTGAGDMFAGAFLYGMLHGVDAREAARRACFLSAKVISIVGARLHEGTRQSWESVNAAA